MKKRITILMAAATVGMLVIAGCGGGGGGDQNRGVTVESEETRRINEEIEKQGAEWHAVDNTVTRMTEDDQLSLLGAEEEESPILYRKPMVNALDVAQLPSSFDWRYKDGLNWMSPIRNQGNCGSCVAHGALAVMEAMTKIAAGNSALSVDLSESYLFSCNNRLCSAGWDLGSAAAALKSTGTGAVDEACLPYQTVDGRCGYKCSDYMSRKKNISYWNWVPNDPVQVKNYLLLGPLLSRIEVYDDFMHYETGVYQYVTGAQKGGHAIAIVGYDNPGGYWIVKNSWGTDWGEDGYVKIKYGEVGIAETAIAFSTVPNTGSVTASATPGTIGLSSGQAKVTILCTTNGNVDLIELRCVNSGSWYAVPGGAAVCTYYAAGNYTPQCRINSTTIDSVDTPVVVTSAQAATVTATVTTSGGYTTTDIFTLTCATSGGAPTKLESRCNTNIAWKKISAGNTASCKYTKAGAYTPGCKVTTEVNTNEDSVNAPLTITGPTAVAAAISPTTGTTSTTFTVTCTVTGTAANLLEGRCHSTHTWSTIASGNTKTCAYAAKGTYKYGCRANASKVNEKTVKVK